MSSATPIETPSAISAYRPPLENAGAPSRGFNWIRSLLPRRAQPFARGVRRAVSKKRRALAEPYRTAYPFTQVSMPRQENLVALGETIERENVPGVVIECGVLDGGTAALMAHATRGSNRKVHLFDAWRGMPPRVEQDGDAADAWVGQIVGSLGRARKVLRKLDVDLHRVGVHHGWFHETFPSAAEQIDAVALLHVDCDFYEPTKLVLDTWWPKVSPGGFVQFDDYVSFAGCRQAVDEFLEAHPELELKITGISRTVAYLQKPAE